MVGWWYGVAENTKQIAEQTITRVKIVPPDENPVDASKMNAVNEISNPLGQVSTIANETTHIVQSNIPINNNLCEEKNVTDFNALNKNKKTGNKIYGVFIFVIIILIGICGYLWYYHQKEMIRMDSQCTPVSTDGGFKTLDLDSVVVKNLYKMVKTNIREDLGESEFNDDFKSYLAFRQIAGSEFYESDCNLYNSSRMEPFTCDDVEDFSPYAFKEETFQLAFKKLFGEQINIANQDIQLGNSCVGGFQYIAERGEYVQGRCKTLGAILYRVEKELVDAVSNKSTIVLTERVKYYGSEGLDVPERLVSGDYEYTFKLDMNYNYILIDKKIK